MAVVAHPPVGTALQGAGRVVRHDVTGYGLHRLCVAMVGQYPDLEAWCSLLRDKRLLLHNYAERISPARFFECYLWLYWKEGNNGS